ncbi:MAG: HD domain-containing protein, partial [Lachnospiraceae bacterium]|nr:HD domain-containing protein [Lachnospiraceae bacterium]
SAKYQAITKTAHKNKEYLDEIQALIYQDQALVFNHIRSLDAEEMEKYEIQESRVAIKIRHTVRMFEGNISDSEMDQTFHVFYSNTFAYLGTVSNVFDLSRNNEKNTANYYVSAVMDKNIQNINISITNLDRVIDGELVMVQNEMDSAIQLTQRNAMFFVAAMVIVLALVIFLSMGMTSTLERYKVALEKELEEKNAQLLAHNKRLLDIQDSTVIGMANLIESRDGDTGEHVKRTSAYVEMLANAACKKGVYNDILSPEYIELLVKAAPLHDIGKIVVPDSILNKPGKLTEEEFEIMKTHAAEGGKIVRDVLGNIEETDYIGIAADVATYHHEKWNGKGYPEGLSGEDIPLSARIMAIADVFDALVSERIYKPPFSFEKALEIIKEDSGSHFDPKLVPIFLEHAKEIQAIMADN